MTMEERKNAVVNQGKPFTLVGSEVKVGQRAPDFKAFDTTRKQVTLSQTKGKIRLLSTFPSLDSANCDLQTQLFEQLAPELPNIIMKEISDHE